MTAKSTNLVINNRKAIQFVIFNNIREKIAKKQCFVIIYNNINFDTPLMKHE